MKNIFKRKFDVSIKINAALRSLTSIGFLCAVFGCSVSLIFEIIGKPITYKNWSFGNPGMEIEADVDNSTIHKLNQQTYNYKAINTPDTTTNKNISNQLIIDNQFESFEMDTFYKNMLLNPSIIIDSSFEFTVASKFSFGLNKKYNYLYQRNGTRDILVKSNKLNNYDTVTSSKENLKKIVEKNRESQIGVVSIGGVKTTLHIVPKNTNTKIIFILYKIITGLATVFCLLWLHKLFVNFEYGDYFLDKNFKYLKYAGLAILTCCLSKFILYATTLTSNGINKTFVTFSKNEVLVDLQKQIFYISDYGINTDNIIIGFTLLALAYAFKKGFALQNETDLLV